MRIAVGSVMKAELIKDTILKIEEVTFKYEGKRGMNMMFQYDGMEEKQALRLVKDRLKEVEELGGLFYNVSAD